MKLLYSCPKFCISNFVHLFLTIANSFLPLCCVKCFYFSIIIACPEFYWHVWKLAIIIMSKALLIACSIHIYQTGGLSPPSFLSRGAEAPITPLVPTPLDSYSQTVWKQLATHACWCKIEKTAHWVFFMTCCNNNSFTVVPNFLGPQKADSWMILNESTIIIHVLMINFIMYRGCAFTSFPLRIGSIRKQHHLECKKYSGYWWEIAFFVIECFGKIILQS